MEKIKIQGEAKLSGEVKISGAKNSVLPILFSTLLSEGRHELHNVPDLVDVNFALKILESLGCKYEFHKKDSVVVLDVPHQLKDTADYDLVRKMRASILVLGPILSRQGYAKVSLPGGCAIGTRPIDLHLKALEKMGAEIEIESGYVVARCENLKGADVFFEKVTVGGTENIMMAAALAEGETKIENAAREPEVVDLGNYLIKMGVKVEGLGTSTLKIRGAKGPLTPQPHKVIADRIEAGTFVVAAILTRSDLLIKDLDVHTLTAFLNVIEKMGVPFEIKTKTELHVFGSQIQKLQPVQVKTAPHPGFPTDLQAQVMTALTQAHGVSLIDEDIFENRFMHVQELVRLGAKITIKGKVAQIFGPTPLSGAPVMATDLRASASLVVAGLAASGCTEISRIYHLDRGYERIEEKISHLGGAIERIQSQGVSS